MQDGIFSKAKDSVQNIKEKISDLKEDIWGEEQKLIIQEFKDGGVNKVKDTIGSMNESNAIFLKSGYQLKDININLGIPPVITSSFHYVNKISEEERNAILEETKEKRIIYLIISALLKAGDFYDLIKVGDYKLNDVKITLGLTPGISISFKKD